MRTIHLAGLVALCGVLAIGTPEAQAGKGGKGKGHGHAKHNRGVLGLPPGHGGIPPGQAKKLYGVPGYGATGFAPSPSHPGYAPAYSHPDYDGSAAPTYSQPDPPYGGYGPQPYQHGVPAYGGGYEAIPHSHPGDYDHDGSFAPTTPYGGYLTQPPTYEQPAYPYDRPY